MRPSRHANEKILFSRVRESVSYKFRNTKWGKTAPYTSTRRTEVWFSLDPPLSTVPENRIVSPGTYPDFGSQPTAVMGPD